MTTIEAVSELRREFARRGWDKKATNRIVFELLIHVAIALAGIAIFMTCHNAAVRVLGILISSFHTGLLVGFRLLTARWRLRAGGFCDQFSHFDFSFDGDYRHDIGSLGCARKASEFSGKSQKAMEWR
jgi:hypothetical protein